MAQLAKNPPAMWETWVQSLGWEDALNTTPVFWPGEFHDLYSPWGRKELDTTEQFSLSSGLSTGQRIRGKNTGKSSHPHGAYL